MGASGMQSDLLKRQGQPDIESAALAGPALRRNLAAVLLGDAPADEQAQPHAGEATVVHVVRSVEAVEDMRQVGRRYADAGVGDGQVRRLPIFPDAYIHRAAGRAI